METIERRVGAFSLGTGLSRVAGLVRESVFAYLFGAGFATDAFNIAFRIPNLLRDLFAESALSAAFVPVLVDKLTHEKREQVWRFANNLFFTVLLVVGVVTVIGILTSPWLTRALAMGFGRIPGKLALTSGLTAVIFPFLLFVALAAWAMGILNACGRFFVPAVAPAFFNVFSIVLPLAAYQWLAHHGIPPIYGMAVGVALGGLCQFAVQLPSLYREGFRFRPVLVLRDPGVGRVFRLWVPLTLGYAAARVNVAIDMIFGSLLAQGAVTYINYAFRLMHLPLGLFGVGVGSVSLTALSERVARGEHAEAGALLRRSMDLVSVLTLPVSAVLIALAEPLCRIIYQRGMFSPIDTYYTAQVLVLYAFSIWPSSAVRPYAAYFYALKDTRTPTWVALGTVALNAAIIGALMGPLQLRAIPIATSFCAFVNLGALVILLRRRVGPLHETAFLGFALKILLVSAVAGLAAFGLSQGWEHRMGTAGFLRQAGSVVIGGCAGFGAFLGLCRLFRIREATELLGRFIGRGRGR